MGAPTCTRGTGKGSGDKLYLERRASLQQKICKSLLLQLPAPVLVASQKAKRKVVSSAGERALYVPCCTKRGSGYETHPLPFIERSMSGQARLDLSLATGIM